MLTVRAATQFDTERIVEMAMRFYATTHYAARVPADECSIAALVQLLRGGHILLVADLDGEVVGMVAAVVAPHPFNASHRIAEELAWWVEPEHRGSRIAGALLTAADDAARTAGASYLKMQLLSDSPPVAARMYERAGFVHTEAAYSKDY